MWSKTTPLKLLPIGFGNMVVAQRVIAILIANSLPVRKLKEEARQERKLIDATQGRKTRTVIITDSNHVILSAVKYKTLYSRWIKIMQIDKQEEEILEFNNDKNQEDE